MSKISKFDENFLEDDSFKFREQKKFDIDQLIEELKGSSLCLKERNFYVKCIKGNEASCHQYKDIVFNCLKISGKLIN